MFLITVVYFIVNKPDIHVCIRNNKVILNLNLGGGVYRVNPVPFGYFTNKCSNKHVADHYSVFLIYGVVFDVYYLIMFMST